MLEIPGYTLLRTLGQGGMGVVYLAVQQSLGREVALKVLTPAVALDPAASERFLREARIEAGLHHPRIVAIHDVGVHDGMPYMAMEYLPDGTVAELDCDASDQTAIALHVVRDIATALDFAHAHGVVHRDVKPENILRHVDGSFLLSDFGIARAEVSAVTTKEGLTVGTPHYMSPEQWRGESVDGRSDLYSLGCVLHKLLTGKLPYTAGDAWALGMQHTNAPIPRLPDELAHVQSLLDDLLAKTRDARPASGSEVARRADALLERHPSYTTQPVALPPSPPSRWEHALRTRRARIAAVVSSIVLVGALAIGAWTRMPVAGPPAASIAVLPFTTLGAKSEDAYFAEGLADELQDALAGVAGLRVASRNSAYAIGQRHLDAKAVGAALNVATTLTARVSREGNRVRISAQLSDTRTGFDLWSKIYDRELTDIFAVQRELAGEVARALVGVVPGAEQPLAKRLAVTASVPAYDAYLRGLQLLHRSASEIHLTAAIGQFRAALAADPKLARAQAGICSAEVNRYEVRRDAAALERAAEACDRAAAMDKDLREVSLARGELSRVRGDAAQASENYLKAIDNPALRQEAYLGLARLAADARQDDQALQYFDRARDADPGNWSVFHALGNFNASRGKFQPAIENYRTAIGLGPEDATGPWNNLGTVYVRLDDFEHAAEALKRSVAIDPNHAALSNLGTVRFYLGDYAEAANLFRRATALAPTDSRTWGNLADALAADGATAREAPAAYEKAAAVGEAWIGAQAPTAAWLAELAWYRVNSGRVPEARALIEKAESMDANDADIALNAALVYARLGDADAARARIEKVRAAGVSARSLAAMPVLRPLVTAPALGAK